MGSAIPTDQLHSAVVQQTTRLVAPNNSWKEHTIVFSLKTTTSLAVGGERDSGPGSGSGVSAVDATLRAMQ